MSKTKAGGVQFPTDEKGGRSTTSAAKLIWTAAAQGVQDDDGENPRGKLVEDITKEKDWRHQYPKHLSKLGKLAMKSRANALGIAQKGIDAVYDSFEFERDGETLKFREAMAKFNKEGFSTGTVKGSGAKSKGVAAMPYKGASLKGEELKAKLQAWADYGTIEASAAEAVARVISEEDKWLDLSGQYFVLLGAGSELGPLPMLLSCGATVVAIRTRKPQGWKKTMELAASSPGTLIFPQAEGDGAPEERAGCDLMLEAPEIRNWLLSVIPEGSPVTVGCYTYLDSDEHVRVSLACDAIMAELAQARKAALAYIGSPTVDCRLPPGCFEAMHTNRSLAPWWMRATGCGMPPVSEVNGSHISHGFMVLQGPNYALAKTIQNWRCFLAREAGTVVSANIGPPSRTESVMHNKTMKTVMDGAGYIRPNEVFDADTASAVMALLLIHDLQNPTSIAQPGTRLEHPWCLISECAVHGGCWRAGFDMENSKLLGGAIYGLGSMAPIT